MQTCSICKKEWDVKDSPHWADICETCGIKATDNRTGQEFFFYTETQSYAEDAMGLMGYGCNDYNFSFFSNRKQKADYENSQEPA